MKAPSTYNLVHPLILQILIQIIDTAHYSRKGEVTNLASGGDGVSPPR